MTTTAPSSWAELVEGLAADGVLGEQWRAAFVAVPREVFIPEVIWRDAGDDLVPLRRSEEPQEWLGRAYGPRYVITQVDDGTPAGPEGRGRGADQLGLAPGHRRFDAGTRADGAGDAVLEIGTGTGYTAALLAHQLGARNVTTIEADPDLAARARAALAAAGYGDVTVITGDGARGYPAGAPFDRVLSTVAAPQVPYAWVAQTWPGGLVITPWGSAYEPAGLLSLTVGPDGTYLPQTRRWPVHQFGPRRLWDEVVAAHQKWDQLGRPLSRAGSQPHPTRAVREADQRTSWHTYFSEHAVCVKGSRRRRHELEEPARDNVGGEAHACGLCF